MITYFQTNLKRNLQNGQALALILLVMSAVLVVGLSVASRSITSQSLSTQTERSQQAFSAAEAGIQEALRRDPKNFVNTQTLDINGINVDIKATTISSAPILGLKDTVIQVALANASGFMISWDKNNVVTNADLEVIFVHKDGSLVKFYCDIGNHVSNENCTDDGPDSNYRHSHDFKNDKPSPMANAESVRIIPRWNDTTISLSGNSIDNTSGYLVQSTASTPDGIVRKVEAKTTSLSLDNVFDYSLYSGSGL